MAAGNEIQNKAIHQESPRNEACKRKITWLEEWNPVFDAHCIDEKVRLLTAILICHLDDTLPKRSVRMHPTDKPWMTPHIKEELKARQRAYTTGDISHYKELCDRVSLLISKAKENYYLSISKDLRVSQPEKWYKTIYTVKTGRLK